ncbi:hypothetical protein R1flu_018608 [Riccia fluitans]|uniref:Uncharacterized protein n=1 Tax=Riccia fluitans TaxID=41844 RepID=A0ABD1ZHQ5_9MARC
MLRTSTRSIGSTYRRLWEKSVINSLRLSSSPCHRGGQEGRGREDVPPKNFHSGKSTEITTSSMQQCNSNSIPCRVFYEDHIRTGREVSGLKPSSTAALLHQDPPSSSSSAVPTVWEENPNVESSSFQQRLVLRSRNYKATELRTFLFPTQSMLMGGPSHQWGLHHAIRLSSSKAGPSEAENGEKTPQEGVRSERGEKKSIPRSVEDFQHEEIVGPTVERDLSALAEEVRSSLTVLRYYMASFRTGFVLLGSVHLVLAIWGAFISKTDIWLLRDLPLALMSFTFVYLLRNAESAMDFFSKMEGRSRLRILTLSLQVLKGLSHFFQRSGVMVKVVAFTSFVALIKQAFPST